MHRGAHTDDDDIFAAMERARIAICGFGEIASKAHLPAILKAKDRFQLAAIIDPELDAARRKFAAFSVPIENNIEIPFYQKLSDCLANETTVTTVAICTPSSVTLDLAAIALQAGKHVLVEKPPGDWRRLAGLEEIARKQQVTFFTAYHTAACIAFPIAKEWLHANELCKVHVTWKESVRKWHPGQVWVTEKNPAANTCEGVLDMVFNPLSLLYALLGPLEFQSSHLSVPSNWETPIAGTFQLSANTNDTIVPVSGEFAWDYEPTAQGTDEIWSIDLYSSSSVLQLREGGCQAFIDGRRVTTEPTPSYPLETEYENLYERFSTLILDSTSLVDETTPRLLQELQNKASRSVCDEYHF